MNGDSEIASTVIIESNEEGEDAMKFLEDVRINLPQVLRVVKTRQVTYSILKHLSEYVQNLQKVGLLEEKEMVHLDDAVQSDFKMLLRNPPLVKMPNVGDLIGAHPLLGALSAGVRESLSSSTKEVIKMRGTTLYKEESQPNGIWLISMGVVKWESRGLRNKFSLHPTFSHGNTLGLYEVLVGKPYVCDMITESVVRCFFFDSDKILSLLRSDPDIEEFLWQGGFPSSSAACTSRASTSQASTSRGQTCGSDSQLQLMERILNNVIYTNEKNGKLRAFYRAYGWVGHIVQRRVEKKQKKLNGAYWNQQAGRLDASL
ncbi:sodium/hydrogen exchanger 7-like [Phalaenopsis equestris]|uniref:sodium/hydrogen exchanger 7-like n=1 Tax=Phalaenopsis equestris TaxID=78828 RepID=UPI0009E3E2C3|nr:sodium/hydrogen exchanger 7-like [Phalaenopsis equestris]